MIILTPSEKEALRHAALEYLAERARFFFDAPAITRALQRRSYVDFQIDTDCVREALGFLLETNLVKCKVDDLGSTKVYAASAQGILAEERRKSES
jgi:alkylation response protein AidB-like acyl-CoA dehydrogenase